MKKLYIKNNFAYIQCSNCKKVKTENLEFVNLEEIRKDYHEDFNKILKIETKGTPEEIINQQRHISHGLCLICFQKEISKIKNDKNSDTI